MHQVVQVIGALLILSGFVLAQFRLLDPRSLWYLVVNLVGSAILTVDAWRQDQWGFFLLELVWAIVSAWGLTQLVRGRQAGDVVARARTGEVEVTRGRGESAPATWPPGSGRSGSLAPTGGCRGAR